MSKSEGNVVAPQVVIDQYGAEVLRLWVASENYREDIRFSHEILKRLTEAYRKIRNTFRYFLGNLHDFDAKKDKVPFDKMLELDRYILCRLKQLCEKVLTAFDNYEFHMFYQSFYSFCVVDLSSFYLDILKDRLYTYPKNSIERRSGQTALHTLLVSMTQLMAPILSFTAEEIWSFMKDTEETSVHLSQFPDLKEILFDEKLVQKWEQIIELRSEVSKALELRRADKTIGHSLDASLNLVLPQNIRILVQNDLDDLRYVFIVSQVRISDQIEDDGLAYTSNNIQGLKISVKAMPGKKCERCWNYFEEIAPSAENSGICCRCVKNLSAAKA